MWDLVQHQIENARALATIDKGRPRSASLRRAVSTAYYAVFHALCRTCTDRLVGWSKPWEVVTPVFRALDHYHTARALLQGPLAADPEFLRLGLAFKELQAAREWADYNPEPRPEFEQRMRASPFTREEALALIDTAVKAIDIIDRLDEPARLRLATRLVARTRK
jgi:hypothetical protein